MLEFSYNNGYHLSISMSPFEGVYGRICRSSIGWFEIGEPSLLGLQMVHEALEKLCMISDRLKTKYSRQKSYADNRRRDLEFEMGDMVYLKISLVKGVMRFDKKGKLSTRHVGPYEISQRVGKVAYELST